MNYVADTHALVWFLFAQNRLSTRVKDIFQRTEAGQHTVYVPAVAVAEMIMVVEKGRVQGTVPELLAGLALMESAGHYQFLSLSPNLVIASHLFTFIPDIFDRLIVADTHRLGYPLITRDDKIRKSGLVQTVWD